MRRSVQPSLPSAMTCCFFSSFKTLLMPTERIPPDSMSRTSLSLAGFQLIIIGRFWVTAEVNSPSYKPSQLFKPLIVERLHESTSVAYAEIRKRNRKEPLRLRLLSGIKSLSAASMCHVASFFSLLILLAHPPRNLSCGLFSLGVGNAGVCVKYRGVSFRSEGNGNPSLNDQHKLPALRILKANE